MKTLSQFSSVVGLLCLALLTLSACQQPPEYGYIEGETMGTSYHIRYKQPPKVDVEVIKSAIDSRLVQINNSMSTYQDDSLITKFNRLPTGTALRVDPDFATVLSISKQVYTQSQGAFDPTVLPLIETWGFGGKMTVDRLQNPPATKDIKAAQALIDFDSIQLKNNTVNKSKDGVALDFSAVAKGYGVDAIADVLTNDYHINNYMIEIGGEVATSGVNNQQRPWQIAIDAPLPGSTVSTRKTIAVIRQPSGTNAQPQMHLATSGNYRNRVTFEGISYSHTIDPISGAPVKDGAPSVTVAADSVALADAWATALTAMPYEKALATATEQDLAALFVIPSFGTADDSSSNEDWQVIETAAMQTFRNGL